MKKYLFLSSLILGLFSPFFKSFIPDLNTMPDYAAPKEASIGTAYSYTMQAIDKHRKGDYSGAIIDYTKALEIETGSSVNEPTYYADRSAIEAAVIELIYQGVDTGLWKFSETPI